MRRQPLESLPNRSLRGSVDVSAMRGAVAWLFDSIERWLIEPRRRARQRRLQLDAMAGLSSRALADIGLLRADVHAIAWGGVPSDQIGAMRGAARAEPACCEARPRPCRSGRLESSEPRMLPEAA